MRIQRNKVTAEAITRGVLAAATLANVAAQAMGWAPLPVDEGAVAEAVNAGYAAASAVAAAAAAAWAWWRNNSVTPEAQDGDAVMEAAKHARRAGEADA